MEIKNIAELQALTGQEIAVGDWETITQERIDQFAAATSDYQWIHVDVERCKRESPFGTTIAHGFLTLSLIPFLTQRTFQVLQPFRMRINYGVNRVRFITPVKSGGWDVRWQITIEIEGGAKPACVAETISRWYAKETSS